MDVLFHSTPKDGASTKIARPFTVNRRREGYYGAEDMARYLLEKPVDPVLDSIIVEAKDFAPTGVQSIRDEKLIGESLKNLLCAPTTMGSRDSTSEGDIIAAFVNGVVGLQHVPLALQLAGALENTAFKEDIAFVMVEYVQEVKAQTEKCHSITMQDIDDFFVGSADKQRKMVWEHTKKLQDSCTDENPSSEHSPASDILALRFVGLVARKTLALHVMDMGVVELEKASREAAREIEASRVMQLQAAHGIGDGAAEFVGTL